MCPFLHLVISLKVSDIKYIVILITLYVKKNIEHYQKKDFVYTDSEKL